MIDNDEQLGLVREQVARLEGAIHSLSKTVRPLNERQFQVLAEGYIDQLRAMRREIDAYLGIAEVGDGEGAADLVGGTRVS